VLEQHPRVNQSVVVAREDTPGDKRLVAYFVPVVPDTLTSVELRQHAGKRLPDYMIPSAFVQMGKLPLTPNGKVDRKALPAPTVRDFESQCEYVAPRDETERKLVIVWEEVLGVSPISVTSSFFDLGGRSILAARLFTKILRSFGKELPLSTLFRSPTVEQLAKELQPSAQTAEYRTLIAIQENGSKTPFFCVHGGAGSTLFMHQLSRELGDDQPFYGIEPEGLDGKRFKRLTVEQMAAHYLAEIRKVQPTGPYYLGGYCFGGLVAFEIACILRQQGEPPALVALFSAALRCNHSVPPPKAPLSSARPLGARLARVLSSPITTLRKRALDNRIRIWTGKVKASQPWADAYWPKNFTPQHFRAPVVLFKLPKRPFYYIDDPHLGWGSRTTGGIEVHEIDANHHEILREPHAQFVSKILLEHLSPTSIHLRRPDASGTVAEPVIATSLP
jgi:thioesterase domain-containing protein